MRLVSDPLSVALSISWNRMSMNTRSRNKKKNRINSRKYL
jgi:hypothetical protein